MDDVVDFAKPVIKRKPKKIILHVGTNNLKMDQRKKIKNKVAGLADSIKAEHLSIDVTVSSIIFRSDDQSLNSTIDEVNRRLSSFCQSKNWVFINNSNIKEDSLNRSGLNLNRKGAYRLASNFREYINGDWNLTCVDSNWRPNVHCSAKPMSLDKITSEIRGFKIALLYVNSLTKHRDELKVFMANKPPDGLAINESKLDLVDSDQLVNLEGYTIVRRDRNKHGGGVCYYLRNTK